MSEHEQKSSGWLGGWAGGCLVGAIVSATLVTIVLGVAGGAWFYIQKRSGDQEMVLPTPSPWEPAPADPGSAENDAAPDEADDGCVGVREVLVKLTGATEAGQVRYLLDDQETAVGDAALVAALKKLAAGKDPGEEDDVQVMVDFDVATAAGITQEQVDAAVKACWGAGAATLPPPDIAKEAVK